MALTICSICKQHIVRGTSCVHCTPSSPATLAVPLALLLGLGCNPKAPEPEVMALYGGPPVEFQPADQTVDEKTESTQTDEHDPTSNKPMETNSTKEASPEQKLDDDSESKIEVIEHVQALYGVPNIILEPILEESQEVHEIKEDTLDENNDDDAAGEDN